MCTNNQIPIVFVFYLKKLNTRLISVSLTLKTFHVSRRCYKSITVIVHGGNGAGCEAELRSGYDAHGFRIERHVGSVERRVELIESDRGRLETFTHIKLNVHYYSLYANGLLRKSGAAPLSSKCFTSCSVHTLGTQMPQLTVTCAYWFKVLNNWN